MISLQFKGLSRVFSSTTVQKHPFSSSNHRGKKADTGDEGTVPSSTQSCRRPGPARDWTWDLWKANYLGVVVFYLFFIFGCAGSPSLLGPFSSCGERVLRSSCDAQASYCSGFSYWGARALELKDFSNCSLQSTGLVIVAHGPSCSEACGIFPDQESNTCLLHWQADSLPGKPPGTWVLINEEARNHGSAQKTHRAWKSSFLRGGSGQWGGSRSCFLLWPPDSGCPAIPGPPCSFLSPHGLPCTLLLPWKPCSIFHSSMMFLPLPDVNKHWFFFFFLLLFERKTPTIFLTKTLYSSPCTP